MKTLILDMYGVIIEESKGKFIPYTYSHFPKAEHERLTKLFKADALFTKAGNGEITFAEFMARLGYSDADFHMRDYIENHLTLDKGFHKFAESMKERYDFALLSNDVSEWSAYITRHHDLNKYFSMKVISADVQCRKPDTRIFEIILDRLNACANDCIFVDNSTENLRTAAELGMNTILFNRDGEKYDGITVYSFDELARIL